MAISTGTNQTFYNGSKQSVIKVSPGNVAVDAFSASSDVHATPFTDSLDTEKASLVGFFDFGTAPAIGSYVAVYVRPMDIDGTSDQDIPNANYRRTPVGVFAANNLTTSQTSTIQIPLEGSSSGQEFQFYIENKTDKTITDFSLQVEVKAIGPRA